MIEITRTMRWAAADHIATKPMAIFDSQLEDTVRHGICPTCGEDVKKINDAISFREYNISGMCQKCQNKTFS